MRSKRLVNNENGMALVIALVILVTLTVLGLASVNSSRMETFMVSNQRQNMKAMQAAESGIEFALGDLLRDFGVADITVNGVTTQYPDKWKDNFYLSMSQGIITLPNTFADFATIPEDDVPADSVWAASGVDPYCQPDPSDSGCDSYYMSHDGVPYKVLILRDSDEESQVYAMSRAWLNESEFNADTSTTIGTAQKKIVVFFEASKVSPWDNAIFAGAGQDVSGQNTVINGNINVAGSVHILGTGSTGNVLALSGAASITNNYADAGLDSGDYIYSRIPAEPTVNGEYDLEAYVRIKNGTATIDGNAKLGYEDKPNNSGTKNQLDGIFITDGLDPSSMSLQELKKNLWADNYDADTMGYDPADYDLGDKVTLPSLQEPVKDPWDGTVYNNYQAFVNKRGMQVVPIDTTDPADTGASSLCDMTDALGFRCYKPMAIINATNKVTDRIDCATGKYVDSANSEGAATTAVQVDKSSFTPTFNADGLQTFDLSGVAYLSQAGMSGNGTTCGGTLEIGKDDSSNPIVYTGDGSLYSDFDTLEIRRPIISSGTFTSPDVLGIVAAGDITIGGTSDSDGKLELMGAILAAGQITVTKGVKIAGTIVSDFFDLQQVPSIYQVPNLAEALPPGMPGGDPLFVLSKYIRKELY